MIRMMMRMIKVKRPRMLMSKEPIEVPARRIRNDLIKGKKWSIRKKERPHNKMGRLLSSKVEQRLLSTKRRNHLRLVELLRSLLMKRKKTKHTETTMVNRMKVMAKLGRMMTMVMPTMTRMVKKEIIEKMMQQTRMRRITKSSKTRRSSFDRQTLPSKSSARRTREYVVNNKRSL